MNKEHGFTLIEVLYTFVIVGILVAISWGAFHIYRMDAEYTKAEANLRQARVAIGVAEAESNEGLQLGMTWSGVLGGAIPGGLASILPGATTSPQIRLGAMYNQCEDRDLSVFQHIVSQPCRGEKYTRWTKFCNGIQLLEEDLARDYSC